MLTEGVVVKTLELVEIPIRILPVFANEKLDKPSTIMTKK